MLVDIRLHEDNRAFGIEPDREKRNGEVEDVRRQLGGVTTRRDRVVVDDTPDAVVLVLQVYPAPQGAEVVAEMCLA